jgi:hypothetical protein
MNKNVWAVIAPDEAISFGIIKPLDGSLHFDCLLTGTQKFSITAVSGQSQHRYE